MKNEIRKLTGTRDDIAGRSNELLLKNEIIGIILLFISIFLLFSTVSFTPTDRSFFNSTPDEVVENYGGPLGAQVAALLFNLFGYATYVLLFYNLFMSGFFLFNKKVSNVLTKSAGYLLMLISLSAFIATVKPQITLSGVAVKSGGMIGYLLNDLVQSEIKLFFTLLFFFIMILISLVLVAKISLRRIGLFLGRVLLRLAGKAGVSFREWLDNYQRRRMAKRIEKKYQRETQMAKEQEHNTEESYSFDAPRSNRREIIPDTDFVLVKNQTSEVTDFPSTSVSGVMDAVDSHDDDAQEEDQEPFDDLDDFGEVGNVRQVLNPVRLDEAEEVENIDDIFINENKSGGRTIVKPVTERQKKIVVRQPSKIPEEGSLFADLDEEKDAPGTYQPPPLTYLDAPSLRSQIDYKELEDKKEELSRRLMEFKIRGEILEYTPGPVITTYEFVPDTGVKVKDVTNLSEDLALVARAQYVRIERILGKKAIGIEIPNKKREIIHLREILESEQYQKSRSPLTIGLGKSKSGEMFISDLREMPHLIVAGATGSGKSVAIHTILLSILYKSSPDMVKLILIDPKRVELALYNTLPHLLTPVVVNTKLAKNALDWAVFEMENRYKKLALLQVRSLEQYNKKLEVLKQTENDEELDKLDDIELIPYIVIVIDEFADLMMESSKEIESDVARIAQKARAVGIHLILATQRPSVDVITGTIKNNFPSRIALAVPSKHDSRTIIDVMGAEKLLGNGDMLFLPPKTATLVRLHCAYVSEEETLRVVNYLSKTGRPKFNTQVVKPRNADTDEDVDKEMDDMFFESAEVVINTGQASASYLQRKMSIGYARAGRLIDQLQVHGVVSPPDSKNKRDILMTLEDLRELRKIGSE